MYHFEYILRLHIDDQKKMFPSSAIISYLRCYYRRVIAVQVYNWNHVFFPNKNNK